MKKGVDSAPDVLIVGGGVMGCASAWALAKRGARVTVLERSVPGAEASSAAAGILGAQIEAHDAGPMAQLGLASRRLYPKVARALQRTTGIDIELRECGVLRVARDAEELKHAARLAAWQKRAKLPVQRLGRRALASQEPKLSPQLAGAILLGLDGRIDPPRLLKAFHLAARAAGAKFKTGAYVRSVAVEGEQARAVVTESGEHLSAGHFVIAAGSWTPLIAGLGPLRSVKPARGQVIELQCAAPPVSHVIFGPRCYLVPRDDGRLLLGSTLEFVGYRREVTAGAVQQLLDAAIQLCPSLAEAAFGRAWSSFRPFTDDDLPLLGPCPVRGLSFATGHFRNGILLAPITAEIVAATVQARRPPVDLAPFFPFRNAPSETSAPDSRKHA